MVKINKRNTYIIPIFSVIIRNLFRFIIYFAIVFIVTGIIFGQLKNWKIVCNRLLFDHVAIPNSFFTIFFVSFLFILLSIVVSSIIVIQDQYYFKNSLLTRIFLFIMNIIPIAFFHHLLFFKVGLRVVYFFPVYIIIKFGMDSFFNLAYYKLKENNRTLSIAIKIILEVIAVLLSIIVILFSEQKAFNKLQFNPSNFIEYIIYFLYMVLFNSISFFTVEYCIDIFKEEYKKNYTKYYFLYNLNIIKRIYFVLRESLPLTLVKMRNNITWLIMFIIPVEQIFENKRSLGNQLMESYGNSWNANFLRNIMYILIITILINTIIDCLLVLFRKDINKELNINNEEQNKYKTPRGKHLLLKIVLPIIAIIYILTIIFNNTQYAIAGYYDFDNNKKYTVSDLCNNLVNYSGLDENFLKTDIYKMYQNIPLYKKAENGNYYTVVLIDVKKDNNNIEILMPYYEGDGYYFINNKINTKGIYGSGISSSDTIVNIRTKDIYKNISISNIMTSYRLPVDTNKSRFMEKPLYLVIPFYICYFITLIAITVGFTYLIYKGTTKYYLIKNKYLKKIYKIFGIILDEFFYFFNSLTLLIILLLINLFLQQTKVNFGNWNWINMPFSISILSYICIQFIIILMFSSTYKNDISTHFNKIFSSNEFIYYERIGIGNANKYYIYNKKYGNVLLLKLIFQNILFIFNINWFICYAFNKWSQFQDKIGITYSISFENIFTKIMALRMDTAESYNFIILLIMNALLFIGYCYYQKRLSLGQK